MNCQTSLGNLGNVKEAFDVFKATSDLAKLDGAGDYLKSFVSGMSIDEVVDSLSRIGVEGDDVVDILYAMGASVDEVDAALIGFGKSASSSTTMIGRMGTAFSGLAAKIGVSTAALGTFVAIAAGIAVVAGIFSLVTTSEEEAKEKLVELKQEYAENEAELSSLNDELKTTSARIEELESNGPLTLTEQGELDNLRRQNEELERTIALLEAEQNLS